MSVSPPQSVIDAIQSGTTQVTRRVEICEADGVTRWDPEGDDEYQPRLSTGDISVDYSRDERRSGTFALSNRDGLLRPEPTRGFWYDKIIKAYRGVVFPTDSRPPRILIAEAQSTAAAYEFREILVRLGYTRTEVRTSVTSLAEVRDYDMVASYMKTGKTAKSGLLNDIFFSGRAVITVGDDFSGTELPFVLASTPNITKAWTTTPSLFDTPVAGGWSAETTGTTDSGTLLTALSGAATAVATDLHAGTPHYTAVIADSAAGGRWFHYHPHIIGTQGKILLGKAVKWLRNYVPFQDWEVQVGEFMIDRISEKNFPKVINITTRDYVKKMIGSKLEKSLSFAAGTPIETIVKAMAGNSGIFKTKIPATGKTLPARVDLERGTERWRVAADICKANGFELFFDAQGYLVMRPFIDPSFGPISHTFKTGKISEGGNLVEFERSTNDSELYNHVVVTGERDVEGALPYFGEAKNTTPGSPTRIDRIGDRMYPFTSSYFTSNAQCLETAHNLLKLHSLESYEMSFSSLVYPWLEAGEIVELLDPDRLDIDPTRFLMDSFNIPMGLGTMGGTAKRITFVEDPTITASFLDDIPVLEEL